MAKYLRPRPLPYPTRRRSGVRGCWLCCSSCCVAAVAAGTQVLHDQVDGTGVSFARDPYVPQPGRNAEWTGNPGARLSDAPDRHARDEHRHRGAAQVRGRLQPRRPVRRHLRKLVVRREGEGQPDQGLRLLQRVVLVRGRTSSAGATTPKLLAGLVARATRYGTPIPFYGQRNQRQIGDLLDLRNPRLRAWAVPTIVDWMQQAPFAGVAFDSANPLLPTATLRQGVGGGTRRRHLLVAAVQRPTARRAPRSTPGTPGSQDLISSTTAALHAMGKKVIYNGIAPSVQRAEPQPRDARPRRHRPPTRRSASRASRRRRRHQAVADQPHRRRGDHPAGGGRGQVDPADHQLRDVRRTGTSATTAWQVS